MSGRDLADRIVEQFSEGGERADIWEAFDLFLPTGEFLNMGYSGPYQTHLLGSPQLRLVDRVLDELSTVEADWSDGTLLDLGCGRGGAAERAATAYEADVVGIDLVGDNVLAGVERTAERCRSPAFIVGDAAHLPFDNDTFAACIAVDSIVYMPDKLDVYTEISRVIEPAGACVVSDLLADTGGDREHNELQRFASAWDMPAPWSLENYLPTIEASGLHVTNVIDLTPHSLGQFRRWTRLFLRVATSPLGSLLDRLLERRGLDPARIADQIRAAHDALPDLRHVLLTIRRCETQR